jgi:hypothetical protein
MQATLLMRPNDTKTRSLRKVAPINGVDKMQNNADEGVIAFTHMLRNTENPIALLFPTVTSNLHSVNLVAADRSIIRDSLSLSLSPN